MLDGEGVMTMTASFHQPEHWRQRAEEMRTLAHEIRDLVARASMLDIGDQYERLALRAEERMQNQPTPTADLTVVEPPLGARRVGAG